MYGAVVGCVSVYRVECCVFLCMVYRLWECKGWFIQRDVMCVCVCLCVFVCVCKGVLVIENQPWHWVKADLSGL